MHVAICWGKWLPLYDTVLLQSTSMKAAMAMKKAELEMHHSAYRMHLDEVGRAEKDGLFRPAVTAAMKAWEYIDGWMQYERKFEESDWISIRAIDVVLKYAPLLLDFSCLAALENLLEQNRRISKGASEDLKDKLSRALERLWVNHRLWSHLELHPDAPQDELRLTLGGEQDYWRSTAESWEKMGLLKRSPEGGSYRLALSTRLGQVVAGKCPACGHIAEAPKAMLFENMSCPECRTSVSFVLLS